MPVIASQVVLATAASAIGGVIAVVLIVGFIIAVVANMRQGRHEVGAELELAANRKPYLSDEELEGKKLDRTLGFGLVLLGVIALALPLYWLAEPGRQSGAVEAFKEEAISRGEVVYDVKAKCSDCHGPAGVGGVRSYTLLNANGDFVAQVNWKAPALNTVLFRYSDGRGEVHPQLRPPEHADAGLGRPRRRPADRAADRQHHRLPLQHPAVVGRLADRAAERDRHGLQARRRTNLCTLYGTTDAAKWKTLGEALFNMGQYDGFAGRRLLVRPLPHQGLVLRHARGRRRRRRSARTSPTAASCASSRPPSSSSSSSAPAPSWASRSARPASAPARCRASGSTPAPSTRSRPRPPG